MFGQSGNTSFSSFNTATQSSPFGQSAFGKPITTTSFGTGAAPVFGSGNTSLFSSKPAGSTTGGLFGNTTTPPAFTQPSFGAFGTTNTNTNLFGTQQNASTNLFGTSTATSAFGQSNKPAGFSFGATSGTNLFGQPQQPTQQTIPFGQSNATGNTNLFGTTSGFGNTNTATTSMTGTVVKFTPVITTDSMSKNGIPHTISARHCCIASMKEYESKCYEELRFEDYSVGRKGPSTIFGAPAQPSPFGNAGAGTSTATTGFGTMSGAFGATTQSSSGGLFGKPITSFGTPSTTTTNSFAFNSTQSTNLFGSNNQNKPFGTAAPTPLFATSNTNQTAGTGFGGINAGQNTGFGNAFGTSQPNQSIGLFNQNKSAFNAPSTSTSTGYSSFGQTPSSNTGTALFGAKSTGTSAFGTTPTFGLTTASTFGTTAGFTAGQNSGTSLFNTPFKPAVQTSGFSFGSTSAPSTGLGTSTGLTLGNSGSNLFGQQKPGGLFGNTGNNSVFNASASFGSSTFGTGTNVGPGAGTGLLNAGNASNQTKSSGTVPVHQQILALVSAPFGDSPLLKNLLPASGKTEELLKPANAPSKILNGPQYKVTADNKSPKIKAEVVTPAQFSKKSMFEGLEEEDPLSEAFQPRPNAKRLVLRPKSISNSIVSSPTENSQTVGKNLQSPGKGEEKTSVTNSYVKNSTIETIDKENHSQDNNRQLINDRRSSSSWLKTSLPRNTTIKGLDEEPFEGRRSPFPGPNASSEEVVNNTVTELRPYANTNPSNQMCSELNTSVDTSLKSSSLTDKIHSDSMNQNSDTSQELDDSSFTTLQTSNWKANAAKVTLKRAGYYTIPPLDKLDDFVCGETCVVPNFTIGREGYGNVYFPESFDIYGLNLDEIVHFRHKEVIIYPDDEKKPPVGQGLNRKAQVTLDRVWPHDKSLHKPITDPRRLAAMDYEEKLRRVSAKHDTRFLEYRPETGSWVFKVDHFSKYGLSDSDEDDNNIPTVNDTKRLKLCSTTQQKCATKFEQSTNVPNKGTSVSSDLKIGNGKEYSDLDARGLLLESIVTRRSFRTGDCNHEKQLPISPTGDNARILGTDSHKLQLMKASFFDGSDEETNEVFHEHEMNALFIPNNKSSFRCFINTVQKLDEDQNYEPAYNPILRSNLTIHRMPMIACEEPPVLKTDHKLRRSMDAVTMKSPIHAKGLPDPPITPVTTILKWVTEVIPLSKSIIYKLESRSVADIGIQMGRMFRPSWGRGLTLLTLSTRSQADRVPLNGSFEKIGSYVCGRSSEDTASVAIVQRIQILGGSGTDVEHLKTFKESIEGHLKIQLSHRIMNQEGDCPIFDVDTDINKASMALHAHCSLAEEFAEQFATDCFASYVSNVWKLCVALWGTLPDINSTTVDPEDHNVMIARREAVGEWLRNVIRKMLVWKEDETDISNETKILHLLSAFELEEACKVAREVGDHCLALLMAQLRSGMPVKVLIKQQIVLWQDASVDENISLDRLKLFALVAGEPLVPSKHGLINVCEGFDWKRALAVHLWYFSSPVASTRDTLEFYETTFDTSKTEFAYTTTPKPEYRGNSYEVEINNGKPIYDLCFHLLKLFCTGNHTLGELLNPATHTADPLDYRLSWLMQQVLLALGYSHLSEHVATLTHVNFATQLEAYGLWHWAVFVMLHLKDAGKRKIAVMNLLERHVEIDDTVDSDSIEREKFLREELGIPSTWINQSKAIKNYVNKRYCKAAFYFIQAEEWNRAHEIIIEHLAADAIINENYDYLRDLLRPLTPSEYNSTISGWTYQGQLLWEYMEITMDVECLLRGTDPRVISSKLESLKQRLSGLPSKINQFPCPTAKHRLCQAEIAKRTLHLVRSLLQSNEGRSTSILQLVSQLPLPEDYAQQELRPIVNMRVNEIIYQAA